MRDCRIGRHPITGLDVLHRHRFTRGGDEHLGWVGFLIGDLARIWEGSQDHPSGPSIDQVPPKVPSRDMVTVPASELATVLAALDIAVGHKRDRAEMCVGWHDQSCPTCQTAEVSRTATASQSEPDRRSHRVAGREATQ
jgi:hypothetical protein